MKEKEKFSWRKRGKSFTYAWKGIVTLVRDEHNVRIHLAVAAVAVLAGLVFHVSPLEWVAVVLCIGLVLAAEAFNSAVEAVCDRFGAERHPLVGKAKDVAAAAVLMLAVASVIVGCIIFIPRLLLLF